MPDLDVRVVEPEVMDQPGIDPVQHHQALAGLRRVNRISATAKTLWREIRDLRLSCEDLRTRPLRILDLACGGGDVALSLARRARQEGVPLEIVGWDLSDTAVELARREARAANQSAIAFESRDVLRAELKEDQFDVIYSTLFLHHLETADGLLLLERMRHGARHLTLIDDLCRSRLGYFLARCGCWLLSRSPIVHIDGPRSVRAAWTLSEAQQLAEQAGWKSVQISRHWPERFLMRWTKP